MTIKRSIFFSTLGLASLAVLDAGPCVVRADPPPPPPLAAAVLDFQTADDLKNKGPEAAVLLNAQLSIAAPEVVLVERQELAKILGEQELGASGTVTPDTAAKVGALTGAKVLITGRLFNAGDKFFLVAKIIGTETSRVYGEIVTFTDPSSLDKAVAELAPKIAGDLKIHADTLLAKVEDPATRLERLKKLVAGHASLPSISVSISERHLSAPAVDPAAETEIKLTLQQLGFEVVDPKITSKQAEVQVDGEGFSEFAGRHGNLVSCRARVEIHVTRPATGQLLLADRQTAVSVDLAENTAAKSALESAAATLLDRIVPALVK